MSFLWKHIYYIKVVLEIVLLFAMGLVSYFGEGDYGLLCNFDYGVFCATTTMPIKTQSILVIFAILVSVAFLIFVTLERNKLSDLQSKNQDLENSLQDLKAKIQALEDGDAKKKNAYYSIVNNLTHKLFIALSFHDDAERLSLYMFDNGSQDLKNIARFCPLPQWERRSKRTIARDRGIIGRALTSKKFFFQSDLENWVDDAIKSGLNAEEANAITMKSSIYYVQRLKDEKDKVIGVVVYESITQRNKNDLEKKMKKYEAKKIVRFLASVVSAWEEF